MIEVYVHGTTDDINIRLYSEDEGITTKAYLLMNCPKRFDKILDEKPENFISIELRRHKRGTSVNYR